MKGKGRFGSHSPDVDEAVETVLLLGLHLIGISQSQVSKEPGQGKACIPTHLLVDKPKGVQVAGEIAQHGEENVD